MEVATDNKRSMGWIMAVIVTVIASIVAFIIIDFIGLFVRYLVGMGLVGFISPFYEEPLKVLGPILIALFFAGTYKSKKMGAILGIIAGAVFGLLEIYDYSIIYQSMINAGTLSSAAAGAQMILRLFTSFPMHVISSLIAGLGVAYAAMSSQKPRLRDIFSGNALSFLGVAIGFHWLYNIANLIPALLLGSDLLGIILAFIVMLGGLYLAYCIYKGIPVRLEQMTAMWARDLVELAFGKKAKKGIPMPDRKP
jgi:hypothetical protein